MTTKICKGMTSKNEKCKRTLKLSKEGDYCHQHIHQAPKKNEKKDPKINNLKNKLYQKELANDCLRQRIEYLENLQEEIIYNKKLEIQRLEASNNQMTMEKRDLGHELFELLTDNQNLKNHIFSASEEHEERIDKLKTKIDNQKSELTKHSERNRVKNEKLNKLKTRLNLQLNQNKELRNEIEKQSSKKQELISKNKELQKIADKYSIIEEFEYMKAEIKKIFSWKQQEFYIEVIREERKYHSILEKTFNMSINDIINEYWRLRRLRVSYAHPFG
jgi:chromosome segregation ATPase